MTVQLGINPLTWTNDDLPSLGAETSLDTCLSEGKEAGFAGFELGNKFPREARLLGPILQHHDLQLVSGWYSGRLLERSVEEEIAAVQSHLTLLRELGAKVLVFAEVSGCIHGEQQTPVHLRPRFPQERWQEYGEKLTEFARYTQQQGVQIAYHHHMGTVIESAEDVDNLMTNTGDEVGLLLDTGHLTFAGAVGCGAALGITYQPCSLQRRTCRRAGGCQKPQNQLPRCGAERRLYRAGRWLR